MFYQVMVGVTGIESWLEKNKTRQEVLTQFLCPFINREITILESSLFNMASFGSLGVYETEKPVDSDWPIKRQDYVDDSGTVRTFQYEEALATALAAESKDVTQEIYREALILLETGGYKELRKQLLEEAKGRSIFFICPFDHEEVNHNYEFVVKPIVRQHQFEIQKVDEIAHTDKITDEILGAIARSRFIIADLTDARPNCYCEVGYAHALRKAVIILAKEGIERHFDISGYKWNFWSDYKDLKAKLEKELDGVLRELGVETKATSYR